MAYSKSQNEATKKWQQNNKERATYLRYKSSAKTFIRKHATDEDLIELKAFLDDHMKGRNL